MSEDQPPVSMKITNTVPFFGQGDTVETRLRKVTLRGFSEIKIYRNATFTTEFLTPSQIQETLHTPQPSVYQTHLNKIDSLDALFKKEGIDILDLEEGHDFTATAASGEQTEWTIIPPTIEQFAIPTTPESNLDYTSLFAEDLLNALQKKGLNVNPDVLNQQHTSDSKIYKLINDGSHRTHYGHQREGVKILKIEGMTPGYPYYAIPQLYSKVRIHKSRDQSAIETKIHVIEDPGHKNLYRLFPSGGIKSGDVRPLKES